MSADSSRRENPVFSPLADRMRPGVLDDFIGQQHILGQDSHNASALRQAIETGTLHSMVFWGPPGTGKTTLARLIANSADAQFLSISAVLSGVRDIRAAVDRAKQEQAYGKKTILFVDEVHRFNKSQQDAFLPYVEDGTIFFIGATTENPSFQLNNALLSRVKIYVLKSLGQDDIARLLKRAIDDCEAGLGARHIRIADEQIGQIAAVADGDARRALNMLEIAADLAGDDGRISESTVADVTSQSFRRFDKGGDLFYDQISALHKSVRGSNPDAALYWFARMLDGGCDPRYVARRVVRMASEDIGNADPRGLEIALNAWNVYERLGSPEGDLAIAQAITYLASTAKSNAVYAAFGLAMKDARELGSMDVPLHLRNAPTRLMKELGHGKGYRYAHDEEDAFAAGETYFPDDMDERIYYEPVARGLEIKIGEKLSGLRDMNRKNRTGKE